MTFFEKASELGLRGTARELGLKHAMVRRFFHGLVRPQERLLDACAQSWPDFDRTATVLEWDRRRQEHLKHERNGSVRPGEAHVKGVAGGRVGAADAK